MIQINIDKAKAIRYGATAVALYVGHRVLKFAYRRGYIKAPKKSESKRGN